MAVVFWSVAALMAAVAVALLVAPLLRARPAMAARSAHALEVYRRQLSELDGDMARGSLPPEQARAARLEIQRRMLAASDGTGAAETPAPIPARRVAMMLAVLVPAAAMGLYVLIGQPPVASGGDAELAVLAGQLAARLEQGPGDAQGWRLLGRSYVKLEEHAKAVTAYGNAVDLAEGKPAPLLLAEFAEALQAAGEPERAAMVWRQLLAQLPPGSAEHSMVMDKLTALKSP